MDAKLTKKHVSKVLKLQREIEVTVSAEPADGYIPNGWGTYWKKSLVDEFISLQKDFLLAQNVISEWFAVSASLAGFLRSALYLTEARTICIEMMDKVPEKGFVAMVELAYVEARAGNLKAARYWAEKANTSSTSAFYRVAEDELLREYKLSGTVNADNSGSE